MSPRSRRLPSVLAALAGVASPICSVLAQGAPALATADSLWRVGAHDAARTAYAAVVTPDSVAAPVATFRLATLRAWNGELDAAVSLYRAYLRTAPGDADGRLALARTLAWAGRHAAAVATYDSVAAPAVAHRTAALGAAQTLAWAGDFGRALRRYATWLAAHPDDGEAALAEAQTLSWAGRLREAEATYARLARGTDSATATAAAKGLARVAGWRSDLARAERLWRAVLERHPSDAEAWTGLAQVLRWAGRARQADDALGRALAAQPGYGDAVTQRRWVRAELQPSLEPRVVRESDSDGNHGTVASVRLALPAGAGAYALNLVQRDADGTGVSGVSRSARGGGRWVVGTRLRLRAEAGVTATRVTALAGEGGAAGGGVPEARQRLIPSIAGSAGVQLSRAVSVSAGVDHAAFDETATLIRAGVRTTGADVSADVALPGRLALAGGMAYTALRGAPTPNSRVAASAVLRWTPRRAFSLSGSARTLGYAHSVREGYFAPERHTIAELGARLSRGGDLGWGLSADAGVGLQALVMPGVKSTFGAQRGSVALAYRPRPGAELSLTAASANVTTSAAMTSVGTSAYWYRSVLAGARVGF